MMFKSTYRNSIGQPLLGRSILLGATLFGLSVFGSGCSLINRLQVEDISQGQAPPSQVAAYLQVERRGDPIGQLTSRDFRVYEDDMDVTAEGSLTLLARSEVAYHHSIILVEIGSPADNVMATPALVELVRRLQQTRDVTVFGFDGSEDLVPLGAYPMEHKDYTELEQLSQLSSRDPSRNLNGAIYSALNQLDSQLMQTRKTIRRGSLLTITRGPDLARRVTEDQLAGILNRNAHQTYAIVLGQHEKLYPKNLGRTDAINTGTQSELPSALQRLARLMEARIESEYLVSYCSPARSGRRQVRIQATLNSGDQSYQGQVRFEINANGFTAGCDPRRSPTFLNSLGQFEAVPEQPVEEPSELPPEEPPSEPAQPAAAEPKPLPKAPVKPVKPPPDDGDAIVPPPQTPTYQ